jgi:hypothetical protein
MKRTSWLLHLLLAVALALLPSCVTSKAARSESEERLEKPSEVRATWLTEEHLQLEFEPLPPELAAAVMSQEEAQAVLTAFAQFFPDSSPLQILPVRSSSSGLPAPWEKKLRAEVLKHYGPARLPLPDSLLHSPLLMALRMSPRYMGPGLREAAEQMFRSPVFLASIALSVLVYFSAWTLPEPLFSKAFAATLTVRLAFLVGVLELRHVALTCLQLYRDAQAVRTLKDLEGVAERFGRALGGTALRVLVTVASFGVARALPNVPSGGLGALVNPPRYALAGGGRLQSAGSAHIVADGTIVLTGAVLGTAGAASTSACTDGSSKKQGYQWHHLATNTNDSDSRQGGPWTPRFRRLFGTAGMNLDDPANLVYLAGHQGRHLEAYHTEVYRRLEETLDGCGAVSRCRTRLVEELRKIGSEVCTPGSTLHRLLMKS